MDDITHLFPLVLGVIALVGFLLFIRLSRVMVYIANDSVGIKERMWSRKGSVDSGFIALNGEAGFEPDVLRGGLHFLFPFQYRVHIKPMVTVPQGTIGYVFARGGVPVPAGQTLASCPDNVTFENTRDFLLKGGQQGPQRQIVRAGIYAINLAQFVVFTVDGINAIGMDETQGALKQMANLIDSRDGFRPVVVAGERDQIGIVTVHDGPAMVHGEIIAPVVGTDVNVPNEFHNSFQNPDRFVEAGGRRGRQGQVLVEGTYFINCLFATVEQVKKTVIEIGTVGVVVSYTGTKGADVSGDDYRHGELVDVGCRGVWKTPLMPGKYPLNPYAQEVKVVPTTNFVLRWIKNRSEGHGYDSGLAEIKLITKDAFEPILPISIVLHISYQDAPWVTGQFADIKLLVEQTLDPMVSAFFKDAAQQYTFIELINKRAELQTAACDAMRKRFAAYKLELMEVMIGTPRSQEGDTRIETIMTQLRDRQLAAEQVVTLGAQEIAMNKQRELNEAEARAEAQGSRTRAEINVEINKNTGLAQLALKEQEAQAIRVTATANAEATRVAAEANARKIEIEGAAEATRTQAIGLAAAAATKAQVDAFGGPEYQLQKDVAGILGQAFGNSVQPIVPHIMVGGGMDGGGGLPVNMLMKILSAAGAMKLESGEPPVMANGHDLEPLQH